MGFEEKSLLEMSKEGERHKINDFLERHGKEFKEAIGLWMGQPEMVLALGKFSQSFGGRNFTGWKDDIDRARCVAIRKYLEGSDIDPQELRMAIAMLIQSFNCCCDSLALLRQREKERQRLNVRRALPVRRMTI